MKASTETLYIPNLLQVSEKTRTVEVDLYFPELETLTPVRGSVTITHQGTYLEVKGTGETIVTLTCHRCLQNYNHRLAVAARELIWLEAADAEDYTPEREVALEDLVETLPPDGHFQPHSWLYEQLCLALPQQQLCADSCQGIMVQQPARGQTTLDDRWAALAQLKAHLREDEAL
jgi:uncharacterized protein